MVLHIHQDTWFWLVICILSVWRITTLVCYEKGPWDVMTKLRALLFKLKLGSLIECFHCTSLWFSIFFCIVIYPVEIKTIFIILAISGGASIIENTLSNHYHHDQFNEDN